MSVALRPPMAMRDFFDWAELQSEPHEFDGFQPVAMTGGSPRHTRITDNIVFELRRRLGDRGPCDVFSSNAGVQTIGDAVRYPDVVVGCTPFDDTGRLIPAPVIVFEVASPSTTREDRILKPVEYAGIASVRRYVIVEQSVVGLTVLWRERDEPWRFQVLGPGDTLGMPEIGVEIPVERLYARTGLIAPPDADAAPATM